MQSHNCICYCIIASVIVYYIFLSVIATFYSTVAPLYITCNLISECYLTNVVNLFLIIVSSYLTMWIFWTKNIDDSSCRMRMFLPIHSWLANNKLPITYSTNVTYSFQYVPPTHPMIIGNKSIQKRKLRLSNKFTGF